MTDNCLLTAVKNEGPDLLEWVAWHRMIGFNRIVVFSNDCTDGSDLLLDALQGIGWLDHHRHRPLVGVAPQTYAGNLAFTLPSVRTADYVMWLDADEFLLVHTGNRRLEDLIAFMETRKAAGFALSWRIFGDSGHDYNPAGLVCENYTRAAGPSYNQHHTVKTLFRMDNQIESLYIHRPVWLANQKIDPVLVLNGNGADLPLTFTHGRAFNGEPEYELPQGMIGHSLAQVNHYATKSLDRVALKRQRGDGMRANGANSRLGRVYLFRYNKNDRAELRMQPHLPALRAQIDQALADPTVARCFADCQTILAQRLATVADEVRHIALDRHGELRGKARK